MSRRRRLAYPLVGAALGVALWAVLRQALAPAALPRLGRLPEFSLTGVTTEGASLLSSRHLAGGPWVADFVFTSCAGPCPALSSNMAMLQRRLPASVRLVSFSVDPDRDTPEVLRRYAGRYGADPRRWCFATGDKADVSRLLREGFKLPWAEDRAAPSGYRVTHSAKFALVDAELTLRGYYDGEDPEALRRLVEDAAALAR